MIHINTVVSTADLEGNDIMQLRRISQACGIRIAVYRVSGSYYLEGVRQDSLRFMATAMLSEAKAIQFKLMWEHPFFVEYYGTATKLITIEQGQAIPRVFRF